MLPKGMGGKPNKPVYPAGPYVPIPEKYANADTSGFELHVKRGSQTFDINLEGFDVPQRSK
jgi:hypothetical protein